MNLSLYDRIMDNVSFAPNGCMLWIGALNSGGYGSISINNIAKGAHKVYYELKIGPVPDGMELDHKCRVRNCINPQHLEVVTHSKNMQRSPLIGRWNSKSKITHCPQGHEYNSSNTYTDPDEYRKCRECRAKRQKERSRCH